jgi:hypothetical protein
LVAIFNGSHCGKLFISEGNIFIDLMVDISIHEWDNVLN